MEHSRAEKIKARDCPLVAFGLTAKLDPLHTENTVVDIDDATWLDHFGNVLVIDIPIVLVRNVLFGATE